jgi:hypothetical protein
MELQLIDGVFNRGEILDIVARMTELKIKYHESKIEKSAGEDDIKMREKKIKQLQEELLQCRQALTRNGDVYVSAQIKFDV